MRSRVITRLIIGPTLGRGVRVHVGDSVLGDNAEANAIRHARRHVQAGIAGDRVFNHDPASTFCFSSIWNMSSLRILTCLACCIIHPEFMCSWANPCRAPSIEAIIFVVVDPVFLIENGAGRAFFTIGWMRAKRMVKRIKDGALFESWQPR